MVTCFLFGAAGCRSFDFYAKTLMSPVPGNLEPPRETSMVSLPAYRVEAPDVLQIEVLKLVPRPPYRIDTYDLLMIRAAGTLQDAPINDYYLVDEEGEVNLGAAYGKIRLAGFTIVEATKVTTDFLGQILKAPVVSIQLMRTGGTQQITGTYLVQQDGIVNLRQYGVVNVSGKTVSEIQEAIEKHLEQYFDSPEVTVDVVGYNSETYFVIRENSIQGEDVVRLPITGKETVLDAIGAIGGMTAVSSQRVWIARPVPGSFGCEQILPIDYLGITRGADSSTNYQLLPGDRVFIAQDELVATNYFITKLALPIYQLLNITQLGTSTTISLQTLGRKFNSQTGL
ncbi:MAG: polysaccharide biosynthesis/export family protein, partial [Thermoguttaceae bacterium]|jgi:polysaccharide export outer membrane protein